ncbi:RNA methyltransferase [Lentibacillus sp. CBA3610]|uniref:TrmH family RNA methyltransferase n=1 Tax=Lentibacillus sp. CBA3610 TaxID=2518176 RepID=UPI00159535A1|nr:RNA methyltransferase [Lentibacillus sp. CBA3610]QKY71651.1 RNA methyltransferase [Lentibacillus sp. CBA3610]
MITSLQNHKVKQWMKLHNRKGRKQTGMFLIEGFHLIEEAYQSNWEITEVILVEGVEGPEWCGDYPATYVSRKVLQHMTMTETPQGIAATIKIKHPIESAANTVLLIDSIQNPGNLGTIIRTADAAGFDMVMLGDGTVDLYNDKVIRATQGSLFHLPILHGNLLEKIPDLQAGGFTVWASALTDAISFKETNVSDKVALIVGNEGAGVNSDIVKLADQSVKIPIYGQAESLNVSVAAGILMYSISK